ncbi:MAG: LLM class flavin-dependent oxidoreductase [Chitinophagaceae bacterium]|nr:LLM class flavin-dependent oxidoreductase [Chitinophagaceae bacterium]
MAKKLSAIPVSILDLATIVEGDSSPADAFRRSVALAQHAERHGYKRYWFAEHHNMASVASAATSVLIGHVAGATSTIRVGAGGVMLPNHSPLVIAEQFGTLALLYPDRIDLGIGRAPGSDPLTSYALRRNIKGDINDFPNDVMELINYLGPRNESVKVRAIPGEGTKVPVWLLGSSTFSAQLAGILGLPFAFASHFAPAQLHEALQVYRTHFKPSEFLAQPYSMACVNVIAADTNEEAEFLSTSFHQLALGLFRNDRRPLPPPVSTMEDIWTPNEKHGVQSMTTYSFLGTPKTIKVSLQEFVDKTAVDEIMVASHLYSLEARQRSLELIASVFAPQKSGIGNRESGNSD